MQRSIVSLVIGVLLAAVAVGLTYYLLSNRSGPRRASVEVVNVVVAAKPLNFGATIKPDILRLVPWPKTSVPEGSFSNLNEIFSDPKAKRVALTTILPGEPVLKSKISGFGGRPIMSQQLAEGMRAFAIRVDDVSGVAGFLLPGDRVDVLLTRDVGSGNDNKVTDVVLQNIKVLGIDQVADQTSDQPAVARTATVEVTTEQAQKLALAQKVGTLNLALRNVAAADNPDITQVREGDLASKQPVKKATGGGSGVGVRVRYGADSVITRSVQP